MSGSFGYTRWSNRLQKTMRMSQCSRLCVLYAPFYESLHGQPMSAFNGHHLIWIYTHILPFNRKQIRFLFIFWILFLNWISNLEYSHSLQMATVNSNHFIQSHIDIVQTVVVTGFVSQSCACVLANSSLNGYLCKNALLLLGRSISLLCVLNVYDVYCSHVVVDVVR